VLEDAAFRLTQTGADLLKLAEQYGRFWQHQSAGGFQLLRWLFGTIQAHRYMATYPFGAPSRRRPISQGCAIFVTLDDS